MTYNVVEASETSFRVAVPNVELYEGDPRLTLATEEQVYPVRLVLQERHAGGFSYILERIEMAHRTDHIFGSSGLFTLLNSRNVSLGVAAAVVAGCLCIPVINNGLPWISTGGRRFDSLALGTIPNQNHKAVASEIEPKKSELVVAVDHQGVREVSVSGPNNHGSMISPASITMSAPRTLSQTEKNDAVALGSGSSQGNRNAKSKYRSNRGPSLKMLIEEGRVGRIQSADRSTLPWLIGTQSSEKIPSLRVSDAALSDLQHFEIGLRGLPKNLSDDAISSMREALTDLGSETSNARRVNGFDDVFVVSSDDANIYFRPNHGRMELVRVLPIEL